MYGRHEDKCNDGLRIRRIGEVLTQRSGAGRSGQSAPYCTGSSAGSPDNERDLLCRHRSGENILLTDPLWSITLLRHKPLNLDSSVSRQSLVFFLWVSRMFDTGTGEFRCDLFAAE